MCFWRVCLACLCVCVCVCVCVWHVWGVCVCVCVWHVCVWGVCVSGCVWGVCVSGCVFLGCVSGLRTLSWCSVSGDRCLLLPRGPWGRAGWTLRHRTVSSWGTPQPWRPDLPAHSERTPRFCVPSESRLRGAFIARTRCAPAGSSPAAGGRAEGGGPGRGSRQALASQLVSQQSRGDSLQPFCLRSQGCAPAQQRDGGAGAGTQVSSGCPPLALGFCISP